jgi:Glycosyltransferase 61
VLHKHSGYSFTHSPRKLGLDGRRYPPLVEMLSELARRGTPPQRQASIWLAGLVAICALTNIFLRGSNLRSAFPHAIRVGNGSHLSTSLRSSPFTLGATSRSTLTKMKQFPGSLGEWTLTHAPYCISAAGDALVPLNHSLSCATWADNDLLSLEDCKSYLHLVSSNPNTMRTSALRYDKLKRVSSLPDGLKTVRWNDGTALIISLHERDTNICHITMRLLLAYAVTRRTWTLFGEDVRNVSTIILVTLPQLQRVMHVKPSGALSYHAGLLNFLFLRRGIQVLTPTSLSELVGWERVEGVSSQATCFPSVVQIGSFANKFAFADKSIARAASNKLKPELEYPLSSDAVAMRKDVLPRGAPPMENRIVYIARDIGESRSFSNLAEKHFRKLLGRVAKTADAELAVFAGNGIGAPSVCWDLFLGFQKYHTILSDAQWPHDFFSSFRQIPPHQFLEQVEVTANASLIVGLHGAGLTLAVFAPPGSCLVEIMPPNFVMRLFESVSSGGLNYVKLTMSGPAKWQNRRIPLDNANIKNIEAVLTENALSGRDKVKVMHEGRRRRSSAAL